MDNFLPPLQKNFNEIRDFITDSTLNNQLDETISFLIECLNINNGYIFLVLDDKKVVVSPSSSPKYLLPLVFSEFDLAIIFSPKLYISISDEEVGPIKEIVFRWFSFLYRSQYIHFCRYNHHQQIQRRVVSNVIG